MSINRFRRVLKKVESESGQVLILVMLLLLVAGLLLPPLLSLSMTGISTGRVYESKAQEIYSADSGLEHALWQIKYGDLESLLTSPSYDIYDYSTTWSYDLSEQLNTKDVSVSLEHVWIPLGISEPSTTVAEDIIESGKLITFGSTPDTSTCQIDIIFNPDPGDELNIETLGIWLSPGFQYVADSSSFGTPTTQDHAGGQAVLWNFSSTPFDDFPGVDSGATEQRSAVTFQYTASQPGTSPATVSWVTTSGVSDVTYTWDADSRVYHIASVAGSTKVESYNVKSETRKLRSTISGDYFAIGNSLLGGNMSWPDNYHYQLYDSTQASIITSDDASVGIPASATVEAVFLYWTGWIDWHNYDPGGGAPIFYDNCNNFTAPPVNWTAGSHWSWSFGRFRGRGGYSSGNDITSDTFSLAAYSGENLDLSVDISDFRGESGDYLYYQFYNSSGWSSQQTIYEGNDSSGTYSVTIPEEYITADFRVRFTVDFTLTNEYVYLDNATIAAATGSLVYPSNPTAENLKALVEETARVNKVLFNDTLVTADAYQVLYPEAFNGTAFEGTWFYTAKADVTDLVDQWIDDGDIESNGAGDYTIGHYYVGTNPGADDYRVNEDDPDYSFDFYGASGSTGYPLGTPSPSSHPSSRYTAAHVGWSLVTIYSSPETLGHKLYLYDIENPSFDFFFGWHNNTDFDNDGSDGGTIGGFLVPNKGEDETLAGRITVFVGEGDAGYTGDRFRLNDEVNMFNTASPSNNVWNSDSPGLTVPGVDIDSFDIDWADGILNPGDSSIQIDIPTGTDGFTMVYMIISFRSVVTTSDSISYYIGYSSGS